MNLEFLLQFYGSNSVSGEQYKKKYQIAGNCCHIIQIALLLNNFLYTERDVKRVIARDLKKIDRAEK